MNITLKRNYGFELIFEAENVRVTEDIEERIYSKTEDGKLITKYHQREIYKLTLLNNLFLFWMI